MTRRQKEVLDTMKRHIEQFGSMPSYRQLARFIGVSSAATIQKHVNALERVGAITRIRVDGSPMVIKLSGVEYSITERRETYCVPATLRWEIWERDNFTCLACDARRDLSVDHIRPWQKGGSKTDKNNLQTLCRSCNSKKGQKTKDYRGAV